MRSTALLLSVLAAAAITSTGCSTSKSASTVPLRNSTADRAAFIDRRAGELVARGAPRDQAATHAVGEWDMKMTDTAANRAADVRRAEQKQFEADLTKMSRESGR